MLTHTVVAMLSGAVLGLRYKVLILAPAITFALVFVVGFAREAGIWWIALDMVVVTTALQLGYLGGSALAAAQLWRPRWETRASRASRISVAG